MHVPCADATSLSLMVEKQGAHSGEVDSVSYSPDGTRIVSGSSDKAIKIWGARRERAQIHTAILPQPVGYV